MLINKTEQQQIEHLKILQDTKLILDKYKIKNVLSGSALLGMHRDGNLIPWCHGVVLIVFYDEKLVSLAESIVEDLKQQDFKIVRFSNKKNNWKIRAGKGQLNIEIMGYSKEGDFYYRKANKRERNIPSRFFDEPLGEITMNDGNTYPCPEDIEGYLDHLYVTWETPIRTDSRADYRSPKFIRKII